MNRDDNAIGGHSPPIYGGGHASRNSGIIIYTIFVGCDYYRDVSDCTL